MRKGGNERRDGHLLGEFVFDLLLIRTIHRDECFALFCEGAGADWS